MELTFNKVGKQYEAEFELSADANLHIEFKNAAPVKLYQRTSGSGWDLVNDVKNAVGKATDVDLTSLIYPKFVKVVCVQEPTYATVTTDGEITEIKSQSKEIEVTSNGTINVTPDAGFSYLNSVKVKTNVPQSGEGGGSASGGDEWVYLDISTKKPSFNILDNGLFLSKVSIGASYIISPARVDSAVAIATIPNLRVYAQMGDKEITTQIDLLKALDNTFNIDDYPRLTKEEFYNLNA